MPFPVIDPLDRRLNAWRPDLADERLRGRVVAERYVAGRPAHVAAPLADLRREPRGDCGLDHQLLAGDEVTVFDERDGWAWVQALADNYVGWTAAANLAEGRATVTHRLAAPRSFVYPGPDLRFPAARALSMGSGVAVVGEAETRGTLYAVLASGEALIARHLVPAGTRGDGETADPVSIAGRFLGTPYLWGGTSGFGVDCSGLVHLAMRMAGRAVPRDSDMQAAGLGEPVEPDPAWTNLRRGDLVFWRGHVGLAEGDGNLLHASGHSMLVTREPLVEAVERIARLYERPIGVRRP